MIEIRPNVMTVTVILENREHVVFDLGLPLISEID
jgi:hypothetical protein